jgi:hypothetical protein
MWKSAFHRGFLRMHEVRVDVEAVGNVSSNAIIRKLFRVRYCLAHLTQTWSFFVFRNFVLLT